MRPVRQGTDDVEIRGKRIPGAGNSKRKGPSVRQGCAGPVEAEPEGQRALLTFQLRGERVRGEGLSPGVSTAQLCCPSPALPPAGQPSSGDTDGCLSLEPPALPLPLRTLAVGTGSVGPRFPAAWVGRHRAGLACPRRDRGPIEPALWASRDNSHTEDQGHGLACLPRKSPGCCLPPPQATPVLPDSLL